MVLYLAGNICTKRRKDETSQWASQEDRQQLEEDIVRSSASGKTRQKNRTNSPTRIERMKPLLEETLARPTKNTTKKAKDEDQATSENARQTNGTRTKEGRWWTGSPKAARHLKNK